MSTSQQYLLSDSSTQPNFQAWAQAISNQFTAAGWTVTGDTGQVNWASNPSPPAANTWTLYEIRQPAGDPLQTGATAYYIRIEYGQRNTGTPGLRFTLGTGTNGAGTLTGFVTTPQSITSGSIAAQGSVTFECDFSWDASRFAMLLWRNAPGQNVSFVAIERTKGAAGSDNSDGVTILISNGGVTNQLWWQQSIIFGLGVPPALNTFAAIAPWPNNGNGTTLNFNNSVPISPIFPCYGKWGNPLTVVGTMVGADCVDGTFLTTTLYGVTRTYLTTKALVAGSVSSQNQYLLMRFD